MKRCSRDLTWLGRGRAVSEIDAGRAELSASVAWQITAELCDWKAQVGGLCYEAALGFADTGAWLTVTVSDE